MVEKSSDQGNRERPSDAGTDADDTMTEIDKFESLLGRLAAVPKEEVDRVRIEEHRRERPHR